MQVVLPQNEIVFPHVLMRSVLPQALMQTAVLHVLNIMLPHFEPPRALMQLVLPQVLMQIGLPQVSPPQVSRQIVFPQVLRCRVCECVRVAMLRSILNALNAIDVIIQERRSCILWFVFIALIKHRCQ